MFMLCRSAAALGKPAVTMREDQGGDDPAADQRALAALSGKSADVRAASGLHVSANGRANGRSRRACPCQHPRSDHVCHVSVQISPTGR